MITEILNKCNELCGNDYFKIIDNVIVTELSDDVRVTLIKDVIELQTSGGNYYFDTPEDVADAIVSLIPLPEDEDSEEDYKNLLWGLL